jgi:hypothetical protein
VLVINARSVEVAVLGISIRATTGDRCVRHEVADRRPQLVEEPLAVLEVGGVEKLDRD